MPVALTLEELKERLVQRYDTLELLELLGITSEELVEAFEDRIADRNEYGWFQEIEDEIAQFSGEQEE
jgi:hypothetical protein